MSCECATGLEKDCQEMFWMVLNDNTSKSSVQGLPTFRHLTSLSAEKEAARLAVCNPGIKFYVLKTVGVCRHASVEWLPLAPSSAIPPF